MFTILFMVGVVIVAGGLLIDAYSMNKHVNKMEKKIEYLERHVEGLEDREMRRLRLDASTVSTKIVPADENWSYELVNGAGEIIKTVRDGVEVENQYIVCMCGHTLGVHSQLNGNCWGDEHKCPCSEWKVPDGTNETPEGRDPSTR